MDHTPAPEPVPATRPAPLSNAERQRRWRARLKAKASGAAVADHARDVVARAILALWTYHERPGPGGTRWAEIDGCRTIEEYVLDLAAEERGLVAAARAFLPGFEGLMPEEARAIAALIDLADVIALRAIEPKDVIALRAIDTKDVIASRDTCNEGVMARLLAPARTHDEPTGEPCMALVPAEAEAGPAGDQHVRLTAARRARRRALRQMWQ